MSSMTMDVSSLVDREDVVLLVGFFDLTGFAKWSEGRSARAMFNLAARLFDYCDDSIHQAGGYLVKSIGDTGFFIFPEESLDKTVDALLDLKQGCDLWLKAEEYPGETSIKLHIGPVACGELPHRQGGRFDVYGEPVNRAAMMKGQGVVISSEVFAALSYEAQQQFTLDRDKKIAFFSGI